MAILKEMQVQSQAQGELKLAKRMSDGIKEMEKSLKPKEIRAIMGGISEETCLEFISRAARKDRSASFSWA